jgi:hypothetical protein
MADKRRTDSLSQPRPTSRVDNLSDQDAAAGKTPPGQTKKDTTPPPGQTKKDKTPPGQGKKG